MESSSFPVRKARQLLRSGDPDSAAKILAEWLRENPGDTKARDLLAAAYYAMGALEEAERLLAAVVKEWPHKARCHANRAMVLRKLGRLDEAYQEAATALDLDPYHPAARRELARIKRLLRMPPCGYCGLPVEPPDDHMCTICGWHYHAWCWQEAGACQNPACGKRDEAPRPRPVPAERPRSGGCLPQTAVLTFLALAAALWGWHALR